MYVCMDVWMDVSRSEIQLPPQNPVGLDSTRRLVHQQKVSIFIGPKAGCNPWLHGFLFLDATDQHLPLGPPFARFMGWLLPRFSLSKVF